MPLRLGEEVQEVSLGENGEMSKHTPGPWIVDATKATGPYNVLTAAEEVPQRDCIVCSFAEIRRRDRELRPRLEADARLIAAAPDMLAALHKVPICLADGGTDRGYECLGCHSIDGERCKPDCWAHQLEVAIAKATGEPIAS